MKRLAGMVKRGELHPVLNQTKWAELQAEMLAATSEQRPPFRARSVFAPPSLCAERDVEFYHHRHPLSQTWNGSRFKQTLLTGCVKHSSGTAFHIRWKPALCGYGATHVLVHNRDGSRRL